jgi:alkylation response protein AidB-like acyl-CoA dehydrogenase
MAKQYFNDDMELFIDHRVDWGRLFRLRGSDDASMEEELETYKMVLRTVGEICTEIESGARDHWHEEPRLVDRRVVVPAHIADGYGRLRSADMICLTLSPEYGGYGLPFLLNSCYLEMVSRADASLMTVVGLQSGVAQDIEKYGSAELKDRYFGSDLGGILTRATAQDGRYFLDGDKIFITNGGADVHLVLARDSATFDQSKGTTDGLNLMLCPITLPDGTDNAVRVSRVERKLGIHGSATCIVEFDHAEAFLLGERGGGFRAMLELMNNARLGVAAQAIGIAEAAYREARSYAEQRIQFGASILEQPLVKSMLTLMGINIQAARALLYRTCALIDTTEALRTCLASGRGDAQPEADLDRELELNTQLIRFLTPLCKYYAAEISDDVTRKAIQIHGGIGYMAETAAGHHHCDSIITSIYEGTSEIQASFALKEMSKGTLFTALDVARRQLEALRGGQPELVEQVCSGIDWINKSLPALMEEPQYALLNAKRVCEMVIDVLASAELLAQGQVSHEKLELAAAFINRHMLAVEMNARRISSGDASRIQSYNEILQL